MRKLAKDQSIWMVFWAKYMKHAGREIEELMLSNLKVILMH